MEQLIPLKYNLPDLALLQQKNDNNYIVWQPDNTYIVLGRANRVADSLNINRVLEDNVYVYQRPSGGESVILSPRMVVFSYNFIRSKSEKPGSYFSIINRHLIDSLSNLGVKNLFSKGISDISLNDKKIMGSSMYLHGSTLFYHAVLNVCEDISLIGRYLKHPSKEPDYRRGRIHEDFVTSLHKEGYKIPIPKIKEALSETLSKINK